MDQRKKSLITVICISVLIILGIVNISFINYRERGNYPWLKMIIIGTSAGPHTLDPMNSSDHASNDVLDQIFEGLFTYNLSDHNLPRINLLAESYHWVNTTTFQIKLRKGIFFHDGYPLNSTAAKWSFDRLNYMCNASNEANRMIPFNIPNTGSIGAPASMYFLPNGDPIIDEVDAVGEYNITFHLNSPFAPFLDLLCYEASKLVSPVSTPATRFIQLHEVPMGTGPFKYVSRTPDIEVRFERNDNYWRPLARLQEVIYVIIPGTTTRSNTMLSRQIDYVIGYSPSLLGAFRSDPNIHVEDFTDNTGNPGVSYYYLGMNNNKINVTWRKAISYAINYSYFVKNMGNNLVIRAAGPISPSYGAAYNVSAKAAVENVTYARQVLVDAGITSLSLDDDVGWAAANLFTINYSSYTDNGIRIDIGVALSQWLDRIGITVLEPIIWDEYQPDFYENNNNLGIFWNGRGPEYFDPFNMLDQLFNPNSSSNYCHVNDTWLNTKMGEVLATTDDTARNNIYKNIQWYLAEELYPHAFGYHPKIIIVHGSNLHNVPYNAISKLELYPIYKA